MRKDPLNHGDTVSFAIMVPVQTTGTIVRFCYRRCYSKTEKRTKLERTHAIVSVEGREVKVPYRRLEAKKA